ncbi:Uncharacterised protein [Mycobacterium tuberculosis]|nr:Uncharacterised protein [Mycobacterium tuberculosis]
MRSVEPGAPTDLAGVAQDTDDGEGRDTEKDGGGKEVLQEAQRVPPADDRDVESLLEQQAVSLDIDGEQDEEAPHGEKVRQARDRPFQQSALP